MQRIVLSVLALSLCTSGCVSARAIKYTAESRPPKPATYQMDILEASKAPRPYKVIGMVQANAGAKFNIKDPIEALRQEARNLGGDALIDFSQQPIAGGSDGDSYGHVRDLWTAKVIAWTDEK